MSYTVKEREGVKGRPEWRLRSLDGFRRPYARPPVLKGGILGHALTYASMGWKLFPVKRDKTPHIKDWPNAATDDADQIAVWFDRWPDANLGLATGQRSGVYVIDIDKKNDGAGHWERLLYRHGDVVTATSRTGGGGFHLFFWVGDFELGISAGRLAPGIDTRGDGGYVVLPPSVHESGEPYKWLQWGRIRYLPGWVADALTAPAPAPEERADGIGEGVRNDTLARYAGALRNVGADRESLEAALSAINETSVDPPLPEREVRLIAKSISRYEPGEARGDALVVLDDEREWVEYTGLQLADLPEPEVTWVVPLIAAKGIVTMLAGEWKTSGKTTLLISAVNAVLRGEYFLGAPTRRGPVYYLFEGAPDEFNQNDFARQLHHEDFHLVPQDMNAGRSWQEAIEHATARCIELGAELLVIDTKTAWLDQDKDEENQSGFARQAMNMLAAAKLAGIAIVVAAHPTKNPAGSLASMVAGSGQWAASAGRQFGIWVHDKVDDPRRQIEAHGRQGWRNNLPRIVIEWDRETNTYEVLGTVEDVRADEEEGYRLADVEQLVAIVPKKARMEEIERLGKDQLGFGRNKTRELVNLAVEQSKLLPGLGDAPAKGPAPKVYSRNDQ